MKQEDLGKTLKKICPKCGKPVAGGRRAGSLTSYLFGVANCNCSSASDAFSAAGLKKGIKIDGDVTFCSTCGLQKTTESKASRPVQCSAVDLLCAK